jgi:hypothetical protein
MQRERASISKVGLLGCFNLVKERKEKVRSLEESPKPFGEFKTRNSLQDDKC